MLTSLSFFLLLPRAGQPAAARISWSHHVVMGTCLMAKESARRISTLLHILNIAAAGVDNYNNYNNNDTIRYDDCAHTPASRDTIW
ncbi:hypothetical protein EI94DRAFT_1727876 [Lactarius quietus]|nr:hypothetical protein EI94DRAFT_1727876 [Lactarius quietus]